MLSTHKLPSPSLGCAQATGQAPVVSFLFFTALEAVAAQKGPPLWTNGTRSYSAPTVRGSSSRSVGVFDWLGRIFDVRLTMCLYCRSSDSVNMWPSNMPMKPKLLVTKNPAGQPLR